eukprot:1667185-Prymnesium_polylepis.3
MAAAAMPWETWPRRPMRRPDATTPARLPHRVSRVAKFQLWLCSLTQPHALSSHCVVQFPEASRAQTFAVVCSGRASTRQVDSTRVHFTGARPRGCRKARVRRT